MSNDTHPTGCGCAGCGPTRGRGLEAPLDLEVESLKDVVRELSAALREVRTELMLRERNILGAPCRWIWDLRKLIDVALGSAHG